MHDILSKFFGFLKYILLVVAFGLVFYGIIVTYGRLDKPLTDATDVFVPFGFVLIVFLITLIVRSKAVGKNLFFNFTSVFVFVVIIIICLRSMFDTNMILFHRYGVNFNPAFFADNMSAIIAMVYMIGGANVLLLLCDFFNKKDKVVINKSNDISNDAITNDNKDISSSKNKKKSGASKSVKEEK